MNPNLDDDEDEGPTCITICQGPPRCDLMDEEAMLAAENGCPWCVRVYIADDNTERVVEPGNA